MTQKIKLMLVEDNPEYRHVIQFAFQDDSVLELINQFGTAELALRSLQNMNTRNVPDVILLDLNLPGLSGLDALTEFSRLIPATKTIVLTQSHSETDILTAIQRGAAGYLLKSATVQEIKSGIQLVMEGGASLDPKMAKYVLRSIRKGEALPKESTTLSEREMEILTLISQGFARKQISQHLSISAKTADNHIAHIFEKLNVPNAPAAVHRAHALGFFPSGNN
ncbi:Oxygen regulatory protein NreC [Pontiella desulfatans]|uniref:Oxygen regulatory protein NreC n=1 Tax=Pontiella desulfatans TaxID=2750659 RepID=A0A6C2TZ81_PONDE|nr:response regulator transcription factor [Pontiella desulfatans]VGO12496.1 Oxygen regulatory protein NreC [Pontiella desulfatans]